MKKIKTSIAIDPGLLDTITNEARDLGFSRSQYITALLKKRKILRQEMIDSCQITTNSIIDKLEADPKK